ncbi:DUF4232 domain-containing protein [Actinoplanes sp. NPDC051343]|uniref:DUF4232 domain-containing protein n=1 Tax=Actinoplanes sp. NPDC051343 TaxID=3363906 RepID=UPI00379D8696
MRIKAMSLVSSGLLAGVALAACGKTGVVNAEPAAISSSRPHAAASMASNSGPGGNGGTALCTVDDLSGGTKPDDGGGAAGHEGRFVIVTNMSGSACALKGFPTVAFSADSEGTLVGSAFERMQSDTPEKIVIQPDKDAYISVLLADTGAEGDDCEPTHVEGYSIQLSGSDHKLIVKDMQTACSAEGKGVGQIGPFIQGTPE